EEGLALTQNLFRMFTLCEIARDALYANRFAVAEDQPRADFETNTTTILRDDVDLVNGRYFLAGLVRNHFAREIQVLGRDDVSDIHECCFFARVAGDAFAAAIERSEIALQIVRVDDVVRVFEELSIAHFAFANRYFRAAAVSYIGSNANH